MNFVKGFKIRKQDRTRLVSPILTRYKDVPVCVYYRRGLNKGIYVILEFKHNEVGPCENISEALIKTKEIIEKEYGLEKIERAHQRANYFKTRYDTDEKFRESIKKKAAERYWRTKKQKNIKTNFLEVYNGKELIRVYSSIYVAFELGISISFFQSWEKSVIIPSASYYDERGKSWYSDAYISRLCIAYKRHKKYRKGFTNTTFKMYLNRVWDKLIDEREAKEEASKEPPSIIIFQEVIDAISPPESFKKYKKLKEEKEKNAKDGLDGQSKV